MKNKSKIRKHTARTRSEAEAFDLLRWEVKKDQKGTWGHGDKRTWEHGNMETWGHETGKVKNVELYHFHFKIAKAKRSKMTEWFQDNLYQFCSSAQMWCYYFPWNQLFFILFTLKYLIDVRTAFNKPADPPVFDEILYVHYILLLKRI